MKKAGIALLAAAVLGVSAYVVKSKRAVSEAGGTSGGEQETAAMLTDAPDFALASLDGKRVRLSDLRGKVVVLNFWATWCPPCREEIPDLVQLQGKYEAQGVTVLGVSLDEEGMDGVKTFAAKNNMNYPILMGEQKVTADYGGIRAIPTTFIINRDGKIIEKIVGGRGLKEFEEAIQPAL